jgi:hypothetical protein
MLGMERTNATNQVPPRTHFGSSMPGPVLLCMQADRLHLSLAFNPTAGNKAALRLGGAHLHDGARLTNAGRVDAAADTGGSVAWQKTFRWFT